MPITNPPELHTDSVPSVQPKHSQQMGQPVDEVEQISGDTTQTNGIPQGNAKLAASQLNKTSKPAKDASTLDHKSKSKKDADERPACNDSDSDESDDDTSSSSDSSDEGSSSDDRPKKSRKKKAALKKKKKLKSKSKSKRRKDDSDSSSDSSDSDSESSSSEEEVKRSKKSKRTKRLTRHVQESDAEDESEFDEEANTKEIEVLQEAISELKMKSANRKALEKKPRKLDRRSSKKRKHGKKASTLEYKRVDLLYDDFTHNFKLMESAKESLDEFDRYIFTVRRKFDHNNEHKATVVNIKSDLLRQVLQEILKDVKGVSLIEGSPNVDPNMLFLYCEELRIHTKDTLKARVKAEKKKKIKKKLKKTIAQCKVLISYLNEDYAETKKMLHPMLEEGIITFDLLWALFKPNSTALTTTYGSVDHLRCFKIDYATRGASFMGDDFYSIAGRYLDYDGKAFGLGDFASTINSFKGARKIDSLSTYPLRYHKDSTSTMEKLIERGRLFVSLHGMNYRSHKGLAFQKREGGAVKVNINGRIMIDPVTFRRIRPNYLAPAIRVNDSLEVKSQGLKIHADEVNAEEGTEAKQREFTDEELLTASPVVFGFAFSEKLWVEFSLGDVRDIEWNEGAFESLMLPPSQKSIVKALVESHKVHAAKTIDDVIQGKGKGLVAVLHGPPGTGKTLTAEGIAELLKCPLYMISAGELGTDPSMLEEELQDILDVAHSWGAILLLDEADVFLETRDLHDISRNALVSVFLRLLEYFQGILFLTTNRVQTFDDAFQSRIHVALRYDELTTKAKKAVWKTFLEKVNAMEGVDTVAWQDADYELLAKQRLNGRQIKNAVRTAQALAVNEGQKLGMEHLKRVLQVAESFERDLKGGSGYTDAMRSYT